jgi:hypothetical protein
MDSPEIFGLINSPLLMTAITLILLVSAVVFFVILSAILQYHWRRFSFNVQAARRALILYYAVGIPMLAAVTLAGVIYIFSL